MLWLGKLSAALIGGSAASIATAVALVRHYPDLDALNRLYAGLFGGVFLAGALWFACLLAHNGAQAWRRVLWPLGLALLALACGPILA
ncbi:hypothetical protein AB8Q18_11485 [Neisseriaceae bacterium CLB008]|nr:hypothetical protein [Neisseriaceae bacterium]